MENLLLHSVENSEETQSFLKENGKKFSNDCIRAMQLMYKGVRLNGDTCKELYNFSDRRLRDCIAGRPDIVRKDWKRDGNGKRLYVEYWIEPIKPKTKTEVNEWWLNYLTNDKPTQLIQKSLF